MCLIFIAYDVHPKYPLVVATNRDEFYKRPDLPAGFWPDNKDLLAGKDLQQGGTWLGITTSGRFATLTNYRDSASHNPSAPSRGHLVENYLNDSIDPVQYLNNIQDKGVEYNGFNLLVGNHKCLYYYSNREKVIHKIEKGIHGLSNSLLNVPWPKVTKGLNSIADCLQQEDVDVGHLFAIMKDKEQFADEFLPQTGLSLEMERMLSPAFIVSPEYGTKSTTVLLVDRNDQVRFWERSFRPGESEPWNNEYFEFKII
ncbi:putative NRDE family protein [Candidatus Syntrophocurvum alkaliphilum]|uniref:Putative NRDE family protein n=1 Tax=Candidatus Syntrophocurvum alkaliphilum TaxID=2293317 RepID=A0A6I6DDI6_9FIRM|nr:NRDE family protein [Candidatus Syntrophocurvum alkaliphilum]QGT99336.1 putative NRDE family protein [Candidatus Syntrophocurvum alkaliphilum]